MTIVLTVVGVLLFGALVAVIRQNRTLEKEMADQDIQHATQMAGLRSIFAEEIQHQANQHEEDVAFVKRGHFQYRQSAVKTVAGLYDALQDAYMNLELALLCVEGPTYAVKAEVGHDNVRYTFDPPIRTIKEHSS